MSSVATALLRLRELASDSGELGGESLISGCGVFDGVPYVFDCGSNENFRPPYEFELFKLSSGVLSNVKQKQTKYR